VVITINTLEQSIISNVKFKINPCLEFACAVQLVGKFEIFNSLAQEMNYIPSIEDNETIDKINLSISKYVKQEMNYFFGICSIENILAAFIADNEGLNDVDALLKFMENSNEVTFFNYLGGIFIGEYESSLHDTWCEINNDLNKMSDYIQKVVINDLDNKEKMLECFRNPEETKKRLCFLFTQFYEKSYKPLENKILHDLNNGVIKYKQLLNSNPEEFLKKYFQDFFKPENNKWEYKINVHVSFFKQISFWAISIHDYISKDGCVALGIRSYEFYSKDQLQDNVDKFLKAISDKRRLSIIKILSKGSYYGYEIAGLLELTPATISYHMTFLMDADIVSFDRIENKVYFILNKSKVKELFIQCEKMLLSE
jgi:DNA-binding transcriptional ArsR family regulator